MSKKYVCPSCLYDLKTIRNKGCGKYPNHPDRHNSCPDMVLMSEAQITWLKDDRKQQAENPSIPEPTVTVDMTLTEYAAWSRKLWLSDTLGQRDFTIMSLGLAEESGEVVGLLKKFVRDGNLDQLKLKKELGDVLYYWSMLCNYFGIDPQEVLSINVEKIESRHARGTLRGSGDDR